jgi:cyclase
VASLDVGASAGGLEVLTRNGTRATGRRPDELAKELAAEGAGEILLQSIDRDGTMEGYDLDLVDQVARAVTIPVVACGGAGSLDDVRTVLGETGASAAAAGSMFVFHGRRRSVLISYPPHGSWGN